MSHELIVPRHLIERFLEKFIPEAVGMMELMKLNAPGDGFTPKFRQALQNLKVSGWANLYADPVNVLKVKLLFMMTADEINAFNSEFNSLPHEEQQKALDEIVASSIVEDGSTDPKELTQEEFDSMTEDERNELIQKLQRIYFFGVASIFNYLSIMVHRKSIFQLVKEALEGNDKSFLQAIQIDKTCLTTIPYFIERNRRAADEGDFTFQRQINTYRNKPIFQTRPRYPALWIVFSVLDEMNILGDFEHDMESFLLLCQRLGVYGPKDDVADLESFGDRLKSYKKNQQRLVPLPVQKLVVKDVTPSKSRP